jgi:hypothetical protein
MTPTELTKRYVIANYVEPARLSGERTIQIRVGDVQKQLGWTNRTPSVFSTLSSRPFQREAGVELIEKRGGPASGGPSTTVQFVYRVLGKGGASAEREVVPIGAGLEGLYGVLADTYRSLGGAEAFMKAERGAWGNDPWERREADKSTQAEKSE